MPARPAAPVAPRRPEIRVRSAIEATANPVDLLLAEYYAANGVAAAEPGAAPWGPQDARTATAAAAASALREHSVKVISTEARAKPNTDMESLSGNGRREVAAAEPRERRMR